MTQHFLLSAASKTLKLKDIYQGGEDAAYAKFCAIRWPENDGEAVCPRCGGLDAYKIASRRKFECKACKHHFSMSKAYGLPGLRIGWLACADREMLQRIERTKHYLSICNAGPSERLAIVALKARDRILARNCSIVTQNLQILDRFFAEYPELFEWTRPQGGCISYPRYLGVEGVERFARELVETAGVLLGPASIFQSNLGPTPTDRFRIGAGRRGIDEGLEALRGFLNRHRA